MWAGITIRISFVVVLFTLTNGDWVDPMLARPPGADLYEGKTGSVGIRSTEIQEVLARMDKTYKDLIDGERQYVISSNVKRNGKWYNIDGRERKSNYYLTDEDKQAYKDINKELAKLADLKKEKVANLKLSDPPSWARDDRKLWGDVRKLLIRKQFLETIMNDENAEFLRKTKAFKERWGAFDYNTGKFEYEDEYKTAVNQASEKVDRLNAELITMRARIREAVSRNNMEGFIKEAVGRNNMENVRELEAQAKKIEKDLAKSTDVLHARLSRLGGIETAKAYLKETRGQEKLLQEMFEEKASVDDSYSGKLRRLFGDRKGWGSALREAAYEERKANKNIANRRYSWHRSQRNEEFEDLKKSLDGRKTIAEKGYAYEKSLTDGYEGVMGELGPGFGEMSTKSVQMHFVQEIERLKNSFTGARELELAAPEIEKMRVGNLAERVVKHGDSFMDKMSRLFLGWHVFN